MLSNIFFAFLFHYIVTDHGHTGKGIKYGARGTILVSLVVTIIVLSAIGAAMLPLFSSSTMTSVVSNDARKAMYMAESGLRYALSELENSSFSSSVINTLNSTTYSLSDGGSFAVNVFKSEFESQSEQSLSAGGTLSLVTPTGKMPEGFSVPAGAYVVNFKSFRDAVIFGGTPSAFTAKVQTFNKVTDTSLQFIIEDDFNVDTGDMVCLAVRPSFEQTVNIGGTLDVSSEATNVFPKRDGVIYISSTDNRVYSYSYDERIDGELSVQLTGLSSPTEDVAFPFSVSDTASYVILSGNNYRIIPTGSWGADTAVSYVVSSETATSASDGSLPVPGESSPDFSPQEVVESFATPVETAAGVISVDQESGTIELGGNLYNAFGAVWFGGNNNIGGIADFCVDGKCKFNYGVRAFFKLYYSGTGDGFTFAFINGDNNDKSSVGGDVGYGELMAYAGDSRRGSIGAIGYSFLDGTGDGLESPKMALEFDTYTNADSSPLCSGTTFQSGQRNDPSLGNKDVLQYVFWGSDDGIACRTNSSETGSPTYDDNRHDTDSGDNPQNIKLKYCTYDDLINVEKDNNLIADGVGVDSPTNWLNGTTTKGPWAVRVEVIRSTEINEDGKYEYTLKTWIRQCNDLDCDNIDGTYFEDTGVGYEAKTPHLEQTVELSATEHTKFNTFLFGLTEATGGATQRVKISDLKLSFIRPGDPVIESDSQWP